MTDKNFEKGYTVIDNLLLEAIYKCDLNATQYSILLCIIKGTYGFHKTNYKMSLTYIAKAIGKTKYKVSYELNRLIQRNIVKVYRKSDFKNPNYLGINKHFKEWQLSKKGTVTENGNGGLPKSITGTVTENGNQKIHNIKNTYIKIHNHRAKNLHKYDEEFSRFWDMYPKKINKLRCYEYFKEANLYSELDEILKGLEYLIEVDYSKKERQFIPMPLAFLTDERWKDYKQVQEKEYNREEDLNDIRQYLKSQGVEV